jgi:hypothetical protein
MRKPPRDGGYSASARLCPHVSESEIPELVAKIEGLRNEADYSALLDRFGIRRTDERFWPVSDRVLADYAHSEVISQGVLDYSRYENR